jgi:hypothetical protein
MHPFGSNALENLQKRYSAAKREANRLYNSYYTNSNTRNIAAKLRAANNKVRELAALLRNAKRANKM